MEFTFHYSCLFRKWLFQNEKDKNLNVDINLSSWGNYFELFPSPVNDVIHPTDCTTKPIKNWVIFNYTSKISLTFVQMITMETFTSILRIANFINKSVKPSNEAYDIFLPEAVVIRSFYICRWKVIKAETK